MGRGRLSRRRAGHDPASGRLAHAVLTRGLREPDLHSLDSVRQKHFCQTQPGMIRWCRVPDPTGEGNGSVDRHRGGVTGLRNREEARVRMPPTPCLATAKSWSPAADVEALARPRGTRRLEPTPADTGRSGPRAGRCRLAEWAMGMVKRRRGGRRFWCGPGLPRRWCRSRWSLLSGWSCCGRLTGRSRCRCSSPPTARAGPCSSGERSWESPSSPAPRVPGHRRGRPALRRAAVR